MLSIAKIRKEWFIEQLKNLKKNGTPYKEIAASLGIKPQYLNLIKNTDRGASEKMTLKLCETFNIDHNDLLDRIRTYEEQIPETPDINNPPFGMLPQKKIPLYGGIPDGKHNGENGRKPNKTLPQMDGNEGVDIGRLFPGATSAVRHYGDSMPEYPSGSILILKRVANLGLIVWGRNYFVETKEVSVIKRLQDGGEDYVIGYSSNQKTYPDGRLVHEPMKVPKKDIRQIHLVLGCVTKEFGEGEVPASA